MKKKITILSILLISIFMINVNAKEVQIYFYSEGGKVSTKDFKIADEYVTYKDGTNHATYKDTDTIKKLNSIKGKTFALKKSGADLVEGKEWYAQNSNTSKYYYFNQAKSYKASDIIAKLGLTSDPYPVISLFANWDDEENPSGSQIDKPGLPDAISISASKTTIKEKEKITLAIKYTPSNSQKEQVKYTSSNTKVATVSKTGVVTGVKKGTATISATTTKSGRKATIKITVKEKTNYVIVRYNTNGGNLIAPHGNTITYKDGYIYNRGSINANYFEYGKTLPKGSGLANYNNKNFINITRSGYIVPKGAEWNTKKDGSGKSYSQYKLYKASDLCNASKGDCTVTLYVNWKKEHKVTINIGTFNIGFFNCGSSSKKCNPSKNDFSKVIKDNKLDIVGLQEARLKNYFDSAATKDKSNKTIKEIGTSAGLNHCYIIAPSNVNAILSKYAFKDKKYIPLNHCESGGKAVESRGVEKVIITINGVNISYYNTHLDFNSNCAEAHMKHLSEIVKNDKNPIIITGDYNNVSGSNYNKYLKPLGFKVAAHDTKLDGVNGKNSYMDSVFILPRGHIEVVSSKTIETYSKITDHNLVIAKLEIKK